jgi:uncharacterized protein YjbI with pentapeptide repeats
MLFMSATSTLLQHLAGRQTAKATPKEDPRIEGIRRGERTPENLELAGAMLINADLTSLDLSGANLKGANLTGANLSHSRLIGCNLTGATLHGAILTDAEFLNSTMKECDLTEASGDKVGFGHADLQNARLLSVHFTHPTLASADLTGADLRAARFEGANACNICLDDAEATASNWSRSDLTGARVERASFDRTDFQHCRLSNIKGYRSARWFDADIRDVYFGGAHLLRRHIMDENYLHEFQNESSTNRWIFKLWWLTSNCGRSFLRWGLCTLSITVLFAIAYCFVHVDFGPHATVLSPLYFSIVTVTTLGYGDILPISMAAQIVCMVEVVIGYLMLGGVLSIFAQKMARRSE